MSAILNRKVTLIGAGRVASSLAHALHAQNIAISEIFDRSLDSAKQLSAVITGSTVTNSLDFSTSESTVFVIAVSDDAIADVAQKVKIPAGTWLFHTSGTVSIEVLEANDGGIFYPLQTFTKTKIVDFKEVPILIEATNNQSLELLKTLGSAISSQVKVVSEDERQQLHIAAVFASNFTNRMLAAAENILEETSLDLEILKPLVFESMSNAFNSSPDQILTGPARRGDQTTIDNHLKLLASKPELKAIYEQITKSIISKFSIRD